MWLCVIAAVGIARIPHGSAIAGSGPASAPTFSPANGTFTAGQTVTLSSSTPGSTIWFTSNGVSPVAGTGTSVASGGAMTVTQSGTIKAIASAPSFSNSSTASTSYTITTLAAQFPGDVGIAGSSAVIWNENFSEANVAAVVARYPTTVNSAGMSLVADVPTNDSASSNSISMVSGGANDTTYLFTNFASGHDEVYVRYYAKYVTLGPWHHVGIVFGGYNPSINFPFPKAGTKPAGNDAFHIYYEPNSGSSFNNWTDFYDYWMQMHSFVSNPVQGDYFGNQLINTKSLTTYDTNWHCYEIHLVLNSDVSSSTGAILELWIDDVPIIRYDDYGAFVSGGSQQSGFWIADKFCYQNDADSLCSPFDPGPPYITLNQQYRTTTALQTNFVWLENFSNFPTNNEVRYSNLVVATQRIGMIHP
jgi:hypothetical protein